MELYSEKRMDRYSQALAWDREGGGKEARKNLEPHVYEASALAYRGLAMEGEHQSILVSGESGAGKTETVKICMNHIANIQKGRDVSTSKEISPIVQRVLDSNPLLEAFGNAKTRRNDNSSRFGKYLQLQFDCENHNMISSKVPKCVLAGSKCETYLLEKIRVVEHDELERTFHIFYQLLAAPDSDKCKFWEGLRGKDKESFKYVGWTDTDTIEGMTDGKRFKHTVDSLALIGVQGEKLTTLMRAICVVLLLGNLTFDEEHTASGQDRATIRSKAEFKELSELMGIAESELEKSLTNRTVAASTDCFSVSLDAAKAKESCDAFAKEIYSKTFLWLVRAINDATTAEKNYTGSRNEDFGTISLLDIFGFEHFDVNGFEQLCINYANEKIQQKFTNDMFKAVQAEYELEGVPLDEITYDDNTDVLDLIESKNGLLAMLNEECLRPKGGDDAFVFKACSENKSSPCLIKKGTFRREEFGIKHYAGDVIYCAFNFVTKNMDTLPTDLSDCAGLSSNAIIAKELSNDTMINKEESKNSGVSALKSRFQRGPPKRRKSNIAAATVWTKYKGQLVSLMENLKKTQSRYIRCIKPNEMKKPLIMQHIPTVEQLRCAGVIAAITISRSAFPNNLPNDVVIDRFKSLWPAGKKKSKRKDESKDGLEKALKKDCEKLLDHALECMEKQEGDKIVKAFVVGRTKSYFRTGALEYLESIRLKGLEHKAVELQAHVRMLMAMRRLNKKRQAAKTIQSWWRNNGRCAKPKKDKKRTSFKEQPDIRNIPARAPEDDAATIMNKRKHKKAATKIQAAARGAIQRPRYRKMLAEKKERDRIKKEMDDLKRKLDEAEEKRKKDVKAAEARAQRAIEDYKEEVEEEMEKLREKAEEASRMTPKQQAKLDETAGMIDYLRKENARLRDANKKAVDDFAAIKANNKKLNDANAQAAGSFSAMDQNARQLNEANAKILANLAVYKKQVGTLKDELKSRQSYYLAEAEARLVFQKAMSKMVEIIQDRCNDDQLVEDVIMEALAAQAEAKAHRAGLDYDDAESKPSTGTSSTTNSKSTPTRSASTTSKSRQVDSDSDSDSDSSAPKSKPPPKTAARSAPTPTRAPARTSSRQVDSDSDSDSDSD